MSIRPILTMLFTAGTLLFVPTTAPAAAPEPDQHGMQVRLAACAACHGKRGEGRPDTGNGAYPRLAGQPAEYLYRQMLDFRRNERTGIPPITIMRRLLNEIEAPYLHRIARFYSQSSPPFPPRGKADPSTLQRGRKLVRQGLPQAGIKPCTSCHGDRLRGSPPNTPALAGQYALYLHNQMAYWRQAERSDPLHTRIARALSPAQSRALVTYLASLRPRHGKPPTPTDPS